MIDNDDLLHRYDRHFLGPTGYTLPFRLRYASIGLGAGLFCVVFFIARAVVHVPLEFKSLAVMMAITIVLTSKVTKVVNADRPIRSVIRAAWNDLNAPRPPKPGQTVVLRITSLSRVRVDTDSSAPIEGESSR
ncbi:hypothetical protein ACFVWF_31070 [Rhodococcus qingshengii]|uniref:hypothetical protein n=1 Tax=Rhodococcus qingshengii TaxID=334542 RepID=UPI003018BAA8